MQNEVIFGSTERSAIAKLNEIINDIISSKDEYIIKETRNSVKTNVRKITAVYAGQSARGYKCHKAYVDVKVGIGIFYDVIQPCCFPYAYSNGKFNIEFFGEV